jgi:hypothetical protein
VGNSGFPGEKFFKWEEEGRVSGIHMGNFREKERSLFSGPPPETAIRMKKGFTITIHGQE